MTIIDKTAFALLFGLSLSSNTVFCAESQDDSVHAWGRWDQMISPAAGPGVATSFVAQAIPTSQDLRPGESQAFDRELIGDTTSTGGDGSDGGGLDLPDVSDPLPDTPIVTAPPTPAPAPPGLPPLSIAE